MRGTRRRIAAAIATIANGALLLAPSAPAATEVGNNCAGNYGGPTAFTGFSLGSDPANTLPLLVPADGVITQWKTNIALALPPGFISRSLQIFRATGAPGQFQVVAASAPAPIGSGLNVLSTRLPVKAGDRIGAFDASFTILCQTGKPADALAYIEKVAVPTGSTATFKTVTGYQASVSAVVEPDGDGDGYGDETQDGCPQSAAVQVGCPLVTFDAFSVVSRNAVKVFVTAGSEAPVKVTGTVKLGKGKKAKLQAKAKSVPPGKIIGFKLPFNSALKEKLKELEPGKKLTLKITASATNVAGQVSTDKLKAKLKGQS